MRKYLRWLAIALAVLAGLLLIAAAYIWIASDRAMSRPYEAVPETLPQPTAAQLADAPRQLRIHGCVSCHGEGVKGRLMVDEPGVGRFWAPNLTELAARSTDQQLAVAIRQGIGTDGRPLFIMPSGMYSRLSDGEVAALIAHIRGLPRQDGRTPGLSIGPLGRIGIATGGLRPVPAKIEEFRVDWPHQLGPQFAAGRRLAATSCSECHGPALSGMTMEDGLITPDLGIAGAYSPDQFETLLRTGVPPSGKDLGLMKTVALDDFSHLTDEEIAGLHAYLSARAERVAR